jgi:hypothetical protein
MLTGHNDEVAIARRKLRREGSSSRNADEVVFLIGVELSYDNLRLCDGRDSQPGAVRRHAA